jgi:hypothetical protein
MQTAWEDLFSTCCRAPTHEEQIRFALANPILLLGELQQRVQEELRKLPEAEAKPRLEVLYLLAAGLDAYTKDPDRYPLGTGPIELLLKRVASDELSFELALEEAKKPAIASKLSLVYAKAIGRHTFLAVQSDEGWREAVRMQRLLVSAAGGARGFKTADVIRAQSREDWVEVAKLALCRVPDGRIFEDARSHGEWCLDRARNMGEPARIAFELFVLGTLHLDPWTAARSSGQYQAALRAWGRRLDDEVGAVEAQRVRGEAPMPTPEAALERALVLLRECAGYRSGRPRGDTLKAILQALSFRALALGNAIDEDEFARVGLEALELLDPVADATNHQGVVEMLRARHVTVPQDAAAGKPRGAAPPPERERTGPVQEADTILARADQLAAADPTAALEELRRGRPVFQAVGAELRKRRFEEMIRLLAPAHGAPPLEPIAPGTTLAREQALRARATAERWPTDRTAAALVWLAANTTGINDERNGIDVLARAMAEDPAFAEENAEPVQRLGAVLWHGEGVNCATSGRPAAGIDAYREAAGRALAMDEVEFALDCLVMIEDLAHRKGEDVSLSVAMLAPIALDAELAGGQRAVELLQSIYRGGYAALPERITPEILAVLAQLAKGHLFATALASGARYDVRRGADGVAQLAVLERSIGPAAVARADADLAPFERELMLVSYIGSSPPEQGADPQQVLQNLRHRFSAHVDTAYFSAVDRRTESWLTHDAIGVALDDRTVLVDVVLEGGDDALAACVRVFAKGEPPSFHRNLVGPGARPMLLRWASGRSARVHPLAAQVAKARELLLQEPPAAQAMAPEAAEALGALGSVVLRGSVRDVLAALRARGKDHLCFAPHGPLHFVPFHLLADEEGDLASHWTVSVLPNLMLLRNRLPGIVRPARRTGAAVFALTFQEHDPFALGAIPESRQEAAAIAETLGVPALPERACTKSAFLEALRTKRWVHLSTHGVLPVDAAALQTVFLAPGADDDGRLFAFELLGEHLDGLEVLTLSACETALGRVDESDNLRGLTGALLQAGVRAIVGTLWEVEVEAARRFFTVFYRTLVRGDSVREAFAEAQRTVRAERPQARDWAPFYLVEA